MCRFTEHVSAKHIHGTWITNGANEPKFVAKFAFNDVGQAPHHTGYVYGNVTAVSSQHRTASNLTLIFMDQSYRYDFTNGSTCSQMFDAIDEEAFDENCNPNGTVDMIRGVPCPDNQLCENQEGKTIPGYQFTFEVDSSDKSM